jgi:hypothetical protein
MNRIAAPDTVKGDFGGVKIAYQGKVAAFAREGDAFVMTLGARRFRVTRTIGTRMLQEYVGVEIGGAPTELRLPWGWWIREARWVPANFFDSWEDDRFDAFDPDPAPWASRCAWCHNTYPYALRLARTVGRGFAEWFTLDRTPPEVLPVDQLVTVGISCESCHLGGREHADDDRPIRFVPSSPLLTKAPDAPDLTGGRHNPIVVDAICRQCHSTPANTYPNGASIRNSSEALDLAASPCAPKIACTDCHDPHQGGVDLQRAVAACTRCHADQANPSHTRHQDATCLDCHMPRIVEGVSGFIRTHRISSPTDESMLAIGAPNACNLCHLDRTLDWTLTAIADGWGPRITPGDDWPSAYVPMGSQWLASPSKTLRITAAAAYARLGKVALPRLIPLLDDPVPFFRIWMQFAIEDALGRRLTRAEYDPLGDAPARAAQARRLLRVAP